MKRELYQKPAVSVISLEAAGPFMQDSSGNGKTPDLNLTDSKEETPESADSKEYNVWDSNW